MQQLHDECNTTLAVVPCKHRLFTYTVLSETRTHTELRRKEALIEISTTLTAKNLLVILYNLFHENEFTAPRVYETLYGSLRICLVACALLGNYRLVQKRDHLMSLTLNVINTAKISLCIFFDQVRGRWIIETYASNALLACKYF